MSSRIQAAVPMAPVVDFVSNDPRWRAFVETDLGADARLAPLLSPVTHIDKASAPALLLHGNADDMVPLAESEEMAERYRKAGAPVTLYVVQGGPHGFWKDPRWAADTLKRSAEFFHSVLDPIARGE